LNHTPMCKHHPTARMRLVPVEVPFFGLCSNARYRKALHTERKCWRCPKKLLMEINGELLLLPCPWVCAGGKRILHFGSEAQ
jgi:hypothetical protein